MLTIDLGDGLDCSIGAGEIPRRPEADAVFRLAFPLGERGPIVQSEMTSHCRCSAGPRIVITVPVETCARIFGFVPVAGEWYLSADLRLIIAALAGRTEASAAQQLYLRAKALELACETLRLLGASQLIPSVGPAGWTAADTRRLMAARELIVDRLADPLTIDEIARSCGLNRAKLTRGFRELFGSTVAGVISEARMLRARDLLLTTDLSVATIGYKSGFRSGASFARAFGRSHGTSPREVRASAHTGRTKLAARP